MPVITESPIELALALCDGPVSIDQVSSWELARPSAWWGAIRSALDDGRLAEDDEEGRFHWVEPQRRREAILRAGTDEWKVVLARPSLAAAAIAASRTAVGEGAVAVAEALYHAIIVAVDPEDCPGGALAWSGLVTDSIRLFRNIEWRTLDILDRALEIAVAYGDLRVQALLLATRGYEVVRGGTSAGTAEDFEHAREAAAAVGDAALSREVHLLTAIGLVYRGKFLDAISVFERFLGDVPTELSRGIEEDPARLVETLFGPVAVAYAVTGQIPRALDIGHRILDRGLSRPSASLVHLAYTTLAHVYLGIRDADAVREPAERACAYWRTDRGQPLYRWLSAIALAWVRMQEHRATDAAALLAEAHQARVASGSMTYWGSALFEVLLWLEQRGVAVDGFALDDELSRLFARPNPHLHGIARRILAMRRMEAIEDGDVIAAAAIDEHLVESEALFRRTGGLPELARTLDVRAAWEARRGNVSGAARMRSEAAEVRDGFGAGRASTHDALAGPEFSRMLIEMGRLGSIRTGEGMWGELAARLCRALRAERCVIGEDGPPFRVLAARGGDESWVETVRARLASLTVEGGLLARLNLEADTEAQVAAVRFTAPGSGRRGILLLENRHAGDLLAVRDPSQLELVGEQLGVIVDNLVLREELVQVRQRLEQETHYYREHGLLTPRTDAIVGDSAAIRRVHTEITRVAPTDTAVLLLGETGVGKELFAREIHNQSARRDGPFVAVHIASLSAGLVASALFGHERGAFTGAVSQAQGRFELANRGTLFLDEIGELGPEEQVRLLRVLQEGTFERVGGTRPLHSDFRLVAATNRNLDEEVRAGRFREDLFYRLNVFPVKVPPLRDRASDIPPIALYFMERSARRLGRRFDGIGESDMQRLVAYPWPGNVRELMHFIERAAVLSDGPRLRIPPLDEVHDRRLIRQQIEDDADFVSLAEAERRYLVRVLRQTSGRITGAGGAAEILGLKPSTLNFRIRKLNLLRELAQARGRSA